MAGKRREVDWGCNTKTVMTTGIAGGHDCLKSREKLIDAPEVERLRRIFYLLPPIALLDALSGLTLTFEIEISGFT